MNTKTLLASLLATVLCACGGGSDNGSTATSATGTGSGSTATGGTSGGGTTSGGTSTGGSGSGGTSGGGSGSSGSVSAINASGNNALLLSNQYAMFKAGQQGLLANAGAIDRSNTQGLGLSLGADGLTVLTVNDANFSMSASGFSIMNRINAGVLMLCAGSPTKSLYAAVATAAQAGGPQGTALTQASDLAGVTLYNVEDCSFQDSNSNSQNTSSAPNASTLAMSFDASGNASLNNGGSIGAAAVTSYLAGSPMSIQGGAGQAYFKAYRFSVNGTNRFVMITQGIPNSGSGGYVSMWVQN